MATINIHRKDLYLLSAIMVFLVGAGLIIGYGDYSGGNPPGLGHTSDEINVMFPDLSGSEKNLQEAVNDGVGRVGNFNFLYQPGTDYFTGALGFNPKYATIKCYTRTPCSAGLCPRSISLGIASLDESGQLKQSCELLSSTGANYWSSMRFILPHTPLHDPLFTSNIDERTADAGKIISWSSNGITIKGCTQYWLTGESGPCSISTDFNCILHVIG